MVIGGVAVLAFSLIMNQFSKLPEPKKVVKNTSFQVAPPPPPPPKPKPKPKPKKSKPKSTPKSAPPSVGSSLSGVDMGLAGFGMNGMDDMSESLLGDMSNVVMTADSVDVPPKPATRTGMQYPKKARKQGVEGYVVMNLLLNDQGHIETIKILESVPQGVFDDAAQEGIRGWSFKPAMYQGKAVKVWAKQKIRFTLN